MFDRHALLGIEKLGVAFARCRAECDDKQRHAFRMKVSVRAGRCQEQASAPGSNPALCCKQRLELVRDLVGEPAGFQLTLALSVWLATCEPAVTAAETSRCPVNAPTPIVSAAPGIRLLLAVPDMLSMGNPSARGALVNLDARLNVATAGAEADDHPLRGVAFVDRHELAEE